MFDVALVFAAVWAFRRAWLHLTGRWPAPDQAPRQRQNHRSSMRPAAASASGTGPRYVNRQSPLQAAAASAPDTGWHTRELLGLLPATRNGLRAGWAANKHASAEQRATRDNHIGLIAGLRTDLAKLAAVAAGPEIEESGQVHTLTKDARQPVSAPEPAGEAAAKEPASPAVQPPIPELEPVPELPAPEESHGDPLTAQSDTVAETTFDQAIAEADNHIAAADHYLNYLRNQQFVQTVEQMTSVLRDNDTVVDLSEVHEAYQEEIKAVEATIDRLTAFRDRLIRNHGGMNEAHQSAPVPGAHPTFYEG